MSGSYGFQATGDPSQWFAVQTRYRHEKSVVAQLNQKRCEVYLPVLTQQHSWSDRQKQVTIPLFPGYAFVNIDQSPVARKNVLQTAGLIGFVTFGGNAAAIPKKQIEDLQLLLQQKVKFSLHPFVGFCIRQAMLSSWHQPLIS